MFVLSVDVCVDMFILRSHLPTITATSLISQVVFVVIVSLFVIFISTSRIPIFPGIMSIEKPQIK